MKVLRGSLSPLHLRNILLFWREGRSISWSSEACLPCWNTSFLYLSLESSFSGCRGSGRRNLGEEEQEFSPELCKVSGDRVEPWDRWGEEVLNWSRWESSNISLEEDFTLSALWGENWERGGRGSGWWGEVAQVRGMGPPYKASHPACCPTLQADGQLGKVMQFFSGEETLEDSCWPSV